MGSLRQRQPITQQDAMKQFALHRRTVAGELARRLSARILRGALRPGTALREERLAGAYETTRTTVRDALQLLETAGLVTRETHRGAHVRVVSRADLADIAALRLAVEPQVVRRAAERSADVSSLYRVTDELESAAQAGDWVRYGEADNRFHTALVRTAGSARLLEFFGTTLRLLKLAMLAADEATVRHQPGAHVHEHRRILELIDASDAEAAASLMTLHLEAARRHVLGE
jgi:DNA-binding GntR family transcriptional regulator